MAVSISIPFDVTQAYGNFRLRLDRLTLPVK